MRNLLFLQLHIALASTGILLCAPLVASSENGAPSRKNVLLIIVDDLKPSLGAYGDPVAVTPHMDRLASEGTLFAKAYCQQAVCGASRASFLTGMRPDTVRVWDFSAKMRDHLPHLVTLPEWFKDKGYFTASIGKVFDPRCCDGRTTNDASSWSIPHTLVETPHLEESHFSSPGTVSRLAEIKEAAARQGIKGHKEIVEFGGFYPTVECLEENVPDEHYGDGLRTNETIALLTEASQRQRPFFIAIGYKKPHLPFVAPRAYWELYNRETLPLAPNQQMPKNAPGYHFQDSWELRSGYAPIPAGRLPEGLQRELIHGYYACVSYIDAQIGKLLEALERNGQKEDTVIVLVGDHGWHLGDHGMWCKHTNYEEATRVPLIIVDPRDGQPGKRATEPVEMLDIAPTLTHLTGLDQPASFEGKPLHDLMRGALPSGPTLAVSQFPRSGGKPYNTLMGYAFRTGQERLILWVKMDYKSGQRDGTIADIEYFDYQNDPLETENAWNRVRSEPHGALLLKACLDHAREHLNLHLQLPDHDTAI